MKPPISLYVHIPYCVKKCPYCDFNSYSVGSSAVTEEQSYIAALISEMKRYASLSEWSGREVQTIFFGGGTPSLFSPESIGEVLETARECLGITPGAEITLEANPGTIQEELGQQKLSSFRSAGVNRISMGVQSFSTGKLSALGRIHSGADVYHAVENIKLAGFSNFNLDLIFGVENETLEEWRNDLEQALALEPAHLSAYALSIEPGTEFSKKVKHGLLVLAGDEAQADMYTLNQELTSRAGFEQYEISNYAKPGKECRHNLAYWSGVDYLGLGAGAHSYCQQAGSSPFGARWSNTPGPAQYIARAKSSGEAVQRWDELDLEKVKTEFFFLGLRKSSGVNLGTYEQTVGCGMGARFHSQLDGLTKEGLVSCEAQTVRLTPKGFLFADGVLTELTAALE